MRVLFLTREYPPFVVGGVATHTYSLVRAMRSLGVECHVLSFGDPGRSSDGVTFIAPRSSIICRSGCPTSLDTLIPADIARFTRIANELVRSGSYDVVHVEEPYVGGLVRANCKVTTIHDTSYGELASIAASPSGFKDFERAAFYIGMGFAMEYASIATSRVVITPAPHVRDEVVSKYRLGRGKVVVVMNGVDPGNRYLGVSREEAKESLGVDPGKVLVFTSGQHVARKRLDVFLQAIKVLKAMGTLRGVEVRLGGDGPLRPYLEALAARLGIGRDVKFLGWLSRDELELHYRASDIFVISSDYEAGPIAMLEAMVAGAAVVSTNIPGFPSLARNGVEALLVPPRDPVALARAIARLVNDEGFRESLGRRGRPFAYRFTWGRVAERTLRIYRVAMGS